MGVCVGKGRWSIRGVVMVWRWRWPRVAPHVHCFTSSAQLTHTVLLRSDIFIGQN